MRVVVTGGTGKAGRWVVADLRAHGHDVLNVDSRHDGSPHGQCLVADLGGLRSGGHEPVAGADAVVHLAAIPAPGVTPRGRDVPGQRPLDYTCSRRPSSGGVRRVVWASLEARAGAAVRHPAGVRSDRRDDRAASREQRTAFSKLVGETMATQFSRRSGIRSSDCGSRTSWSRTITPSSRPMGRRAAPPWNLWGYVDCRDVAQACRLALEAKVTGAPVCIVAAADTVMTRPSADLMAEVYPDVPLTVPSRAARRCWRSTGRGGSWGMTQRIGGRTTWRSPGSGHGPRSPTRGRVRGGPWRHFVFGGSPACPCSSSFPGPGTRPALRWEPSGRAAGVGRPRGDHRGDGGTMVDAEIVEDRHGSRGPSASRPSASPSC